MSISPISYWGPVTSTIDWCEPNYQLSPYIAEPLNTVSNFSFVLLGLLGMFHELSERSKRSYMIMYLTISLIGLGSMLFHGTLTVWGQQLDELPMVWHLLMTMYAVNREFVGHNLETKSVVATLLILYAILFSILHIALQTTTAFQVHFGILLGTLLFGIYYRFKHIELCSEGWTLTLLFLGSGCLALLCWLVDYHGCETIQALKSSGYLSFNPHGHVLWHLFMGYSAYCSVVWLKYLEECHDQRAILVQYWLGVLPFISRQRETISKLQYLPPSGKSTPVSSYHLLFPTLSRSMMKGEETDALTDTEHNMLTYQEIEELLS